MWKDVLNAFEVVGNGLAWRVGFGTLLRIGRDPWEDSSRENILPEELCSILDRGGYFYLAQVGEPVASNLWHEGWK